MEMQHIIYMQEASGQPHIDQYRSKLFSLYTCLLMIDCECQQKLNAKYICWC